MNVYVYASVSVHMCVCIYIYIYRYISCTYIASCMLVFHLYDMFIVYIIYIYIYIKLYTDIRYVYFQSETAQHEANERNRLEGR